MRKSSITQGTKATYEQILLNSITNTLTGTAVATAIYIPALDDTDGGAWRKRCQHTSWYAELGEFPAVVGIVATSSTVTLYDMTDPDHDSWMVFNEGGTSSSNMNMIDSTASDLTSVTAKNGVLVVGRDSGYGITLVDFNADNAAHVWSSTQQAVGGISNRNDGLGYYSLNSNHLVNSTVNDIALCVLPNAPIDAATGLPVVTAVVFTEGGCSVIKDDGTVVDSSSAVALISGSITDDYRVVSCRNGADVRFYSGPSLIGIGASWNLIDTFQYSTTTVPALLTDSGYGVVLDGVRGGSTGLTHLHENLTTPAEGSVAYTTANQCSGWMTGAIKGAFALPTDHATGAGALVGSELVDNHDMSEATGADYTLGSGITYDATDDELDFASSTSNAYQEVDFTETGVYLLDVTVNKYTSGGILAGHQSGGTATYTALSSSVTINATGTTTRTIEVTAIGTVRLGAWASGSTTASVNNISVRKAIPDVSVNDNGIAVHGTLDVTAVATGADLLAISGFGVSDYGEQPYNADLNFADGVFTFECWIKTTDSDGGSNVIFERSDGTLNGVIRAYTVDGYFGIYTAEGGAASFFRGGPVISDGNWHHVVGVQDLSGLTVYIDSVAGASVSESAASTIRDIDNTSAISRIGTYKYVTGTAVFEGSLTLPRITGTALSAAEVKRHYNSERPLFNENAACTLVGNSDAITALDHDAETDLLHVGTSGGRSTFQGLVRTGEDTATTSQSLTAISAKDKIILEGK